MLSREDIRIPRGWEIMAGGDTGTYMGGACAAVSPDRDPIIVVLDEYPNYRYTGDGTIELTGMTVSEWIAMVSESLRFWTKQRRFGMWVDANTTFKSEVGRGLSFRMNRKDLELRTEITREYLRNGRLLLAPWLKVIPREMEWAHYPEQESGSTGRYRRVKEKDHCLDGVEHICSRRPRPLFQEAPKGRNSAIEEILAKARQSMPHVREIDPFLGIN